VLLTTYPLISSFCESLKLTHYAHGAQTLWEADVSHKPSSSVKVTCSRLPAPGLDK